MDAMELNRTKWNATVFLFLLLHHFSRFAYTPFHRSYNVCAFRCSWHGKKPNKLFVQMCVTVWCVSIHTSIHIVNRPRVYWVMQIRPMPWYTSHTQTSAYQPNCCCCCCTCTIVGSPHQTIIIDGWRSHSVRQRCGARMWASINSFQCK